MTCGASPRRAEVARVSPTGKGVLWITLQRQGGPELGEAWPGAEQELSSAAGACAAPPAACGGPDPPTGRPFPRPLEPRAPPTSPAPARSPASSPCRRAGSCAKSAPAGRASLCPARNPLSRLRLRLLRAWAQPPGSTDVSPQLGVHNHPSVVRALTVGRPRASDPSRLSLRVVWRLMVVWTALGVKTCLRHLPEPPFSPRGG